MKFHFLGTSAGSPSIERNVTALGVTFEQKKEWYLFDAGDGTQQQILRTSLSLPRLEKIFITHMHGDHCYGVPGILTSRGLMSGAGAKITIYGPKGIKEFIETVLRLSHTILEYELDFVEFTKSQTLYENDNEIVKCVQLSHDVPSFAFVYEEKDRQGTFDLNKAKEANIPGGPVYGRLSRGENVVLGDGREFCGADFIGPSRKGRKVIIAGDNDSPDLLAEDLQDADLFVHEATHTIEVKENLTWDSRHSTAAAVAEIAEKRSVHNLIITHISARFSLRVRDNDNASIYRVREEAESFYNGNLNMAQDYDCFSLSRQGDLTLEFRKNVKRKK